MRAIFDLSASEASQFPRRGYAVSPVANGGVEQ